MENKQSAFTLQLRHEKCYTYVRYWSLVKASGYLLAFIQTGEKKRERCDK